MKSRYANLLLVMLSALLAIALAYTVWLGTQNAAQQRLDRHYLNEGAIRIEVQAEIHSKQSALSSFLSRGNSILRLREDGFDLQALADRTDYDLLSGEQLTASLLNSGEAFCFTGQDAQAPQNYSKLGKLGLDLPSALDVYTITAQKEESLQPGLYIIDGKKNTEKSLHNLMAAFPGSIKRISLEGIKPLRLTKNLSVSTFQMWSLLIISMLGIMFGLSFWLDSRRQLMHLLWFIGIRYRTRILHVFVRVAACILSGLLLGAIFAALLMPRIHWMSLMPLLMLFLVFSLCTLLFAQTRLDKSMTVQGVR